MLCFYPELNSACYHVLYKKERCCYIITLNGEADMRLPAAPEMKLVTLTKEITMTKKAQCEKILQLETNNLIFCSCLYLYSVFQRTDLLNINDNQSVLVAVAICTVKHTVPKNQSCFVHHEMSHPVSKLQQDVNSFTINRGIIGLDRPNCSATFVTPHLTTDSLSIMVQKSIMVHSRKFCLFERDSSIEGNIHVKCTQWHY